MPVDRRPPHVAAVHVYPVKSFRGASLAGSRLERQGLRDDRRWMVVDPAGSVLTARTLPGMLAVTAVARASGDLVLTAATMPPLHVARPWDGLLVPVSLGRVGHAVDAGPVAGAWLTTVLGRPARLVWLDDPTRRTVSAEHGGRAGDVLSLADTAPLLLTTVASLRRLDRWVADTYAARHASCGAQAGARPAALSMERFRPNIVVDGDLEPFEEDGWLTVQVGGVRLRFAEHTDRCVLTTLDPGTLERGPEPLRSLSRHRRWDGKVWFGVRLVPVSTGTVAVGDEVSVLEASSPAVGARRPLAAPCEALETVAAR